MQNYLNNPLLKAAGVKIEFTQFQLEEYIKCSRDPVYFIRNYCKIVSLDKGIIPFIPFSYQERIITAIHENQNTIGKLFRQAGKCVHYDTGIKLRNRNTGQILEISIGEFFTEWVKKAS